MTYTTPRQPAPFGTTRITDFEQLDDDSVDSSTCNVATEQVFTIVDSSWDAVSDELKQQLLEGTLWGLEILTAEPTATIQTFNAGAITNFYNQMGTNTSDFISFVGNKPNGDLYSCMGLSIRPDGVAQFGFAPIFTQQIYFESNWIEWVCSKVKAAGCTGFLWTISKSYDSLASEIKYQFRNCCFVMVAEKFKAWADANGATLEVDSGEDGVYFTVVF